MKRAGRLFQQILEWHNLRLAVAQAMRGKRHRPATREFLRHLDDNLLAMKQQLDARTFPIGKFSQFVIHDPKERVITAPCFPERVLHHAIMNVCEPEFERSLIDDTFACRRGRGQVVAVERARQFSRRYGFFLKLDTRKYFDSVGHKRLLKLLETRFKDALLMDLFGRIIGSFRSTVGSGLPIGSLTSQHFANFYLGVFDRWVKEECRVRGYVRYMDDMVLWGDSKRELNRIITACDGFLAGELGLRAVRFVNRTKHGVDFLGCRVFRNKVTLNRRSRARFRRKLYALEREYLDGAIGELELQQRVTSLVSFTRAGNISSWHFRRRVLEQSPVGGQMARIG